MKIKTKVILAPLLVYILLLVIGILAFMRNSEIQKNTKILKEEYTKSQVDKNTPEAQNTLAILNTIELSSSTILILIPPFLVVSFMVTIGTGYFVYSTIQKSLSSIQEVATQITRGAFNQRVQHISHDEIGVLALTLNSVIDKLQEAYKTLEKNTIDFMKRYSEVEHVRRATFNILDDLETEKVKVEAEKVKDEAILTSIGEGMVTTDEKKNIIMMNAAAENMMGYKLSEIHGHQYSDVFKTVDNEGFPIPDQELPIQKALVTGQKQFATQYLIRRDGSRFAAAKTASPIITQQKTIGAIVIFRDVTRETEVDRMKTEFISLASHQLRTPLSAIKWFGEMLLDGDVGTLTPEQKEVMDNIYQSNERMIALVNSLLNISRIESGRIIVDPVPTDLKELVEGVISEVHPHAQEKQQSLIVSVHGDLPKINLDPKLIRQVYLNLLTNSIKYTPHNGEISVIISKKDDQVISQVSDNGYGIPKQQQDRMFQKFFRADNVVRVEPDGTGLGMYLVKSIIDSSHGKVWFESSEGHGTSFWFSLPLSGMTARKGEVTLDT